jgi:hypothetical protein
MQEPGSPSWENLKFETVKYGHEPHGTRARRRRIRCPGPSATANCRPIVNRQRENLTSTNPQLPIDSLKRGEGNCRLFPDGCLIPRQTGRLGVGGKVTDFWQELTSVEFVKKNCLP